MANSKLRLYASLNPEFSVDHETGNGAQDNVNLREGTCSVCHETREEANSAISGKVRLMKLDREEK